MCSPKFFADALDGKEARFEGRHQASRAVPGSSLLAEMLYGGCTATQHSAGRDAEEVEGPLWSVCGRTFRKKIV